jgi:phosphatidylglycerol:prolipoprotein diacylglycerol transferase
MPLLVIPYPAFDPVLVHLGPFAVRWYALAYIVGILLGWGYARILIRSGKLWGGKAPLTVTGLRRFRPLGDTWHHSRRTHRLRSLLQPSAFRCAPAGNFQLWNGGMSFHGGFTGCVIAVLAFGYMRGIPVLSLGDITCAVGPIGLFLGRIANFINGELWGRPTDVSWAMVFPERRPMPRHPSQLYEATLEGLVLLAVLALLMRAGALKRPGLIIGSFAVCYAIARTFCEFFREPDAQLGFLWGGATMGQLLSCRCSSPAWVSSLCDETPAAAEPLVSERSPLEIEIADASRRRGQCRSLSTWRSACSTASMATTSRVIRSARAATLRQRQKSAQMFGELIGLWAATVWTQMGTPEMCG